MVYAFAVGVTVATVLIRLSLEESFGGQIFLILFMIPISLSAYLGGLGPGLVSTLVAAACSLYFLIPPTYSFAIQKMTNFVLLLVLIGTGAFVSVLSESLHSSRWQLLRLNEELKQRVEERTSDLTRANAALQQSEENLHFLTSQTLSAQEKERKRISHELHDSLGQSLTVLKLQLRGIQKMMPSTGQEKEEIESTLNYVNSIIENVRRLSKALSPQLLEDLGLSTALSQLFDETCELQEIKCFLTTDDISELFPSETQVIIYRIIQEILNNIIKHAKANRIEFGVKKWNEKVQFWVNDDGIGFNLNHTLTSSLKYRGLGLAYMEEQARMLNGVLAIRSKEGEGTWINLTVPF